jgi:hypothetical protein
MHNIENSGDCGGGVLVLLGLERAHAVENQIENPHSDGQSGGGPHDRPGRQGVSRGGLRSGEKTSRLRDAIASPIRTAHLVTLDEGPDPPDVGDGQRDAEELGQAQRGTTRGDVDEPGEGQVEDEQLNKDFVTRVRQKNAGLTLK